MLDAEQNPSTATATVENSPLGKLDLSRRDDPAMFRRLVEQHYPDPDIRALCLRQLAESIATAHAISPKTWCISLRKSDPAPKLNVGRIQVLRLHANHLDVWVDRESASDELWRDIQEDLGLELLWGGNTPSSSPYAYGVSPAGPQIAVALPTLRPLHLALIKRAAQARRSTMFAPMHNPGMVEYLRQELGVDIPQPAYLDQTRERPPASPSASTPGEIANQEASGSDEMQADSPVSVWWVNQGATYKAAREGGYLWARTANDAGQAFYYWTNLQKLQPGDIVLHYAHSMIRAVSRVFSPATVAPQPTSGESDQPDRDGHLVQVDYHDLTPTIPLAEIPLSWRTTDEGPFTVDGGVIQGYLFPLSNEFFHRLVTTFEREWPAFAHRQPALEPEPSYVEPSFPEIVDRVADQGLRLDERTLRRYHLALQTRGFVILSGLSGTGKTWLTEVYANAVGARHAVIPIAPNWTTNEDLLGYHNPITGAYHDTAFGRFLREAAAAWQRAEAAGTAARPYHVVLDEMNLARVEYYFAKFLSAMEARARTQVATIEFGPDEAVPLTPNLKVIGTVNIDETTHGFADKIYDRAQLVELEASRADIAAHLAGRAYREDLLLIWDAVHRIGPFTFRVLDEIAAYVDGALALDVPWDEALDEQLLQKVLPKIKGADHAISEGLAEFVTITSERFPLSHARAAAMLEGFRRHGFTSYFR